MSRKTAALLLALATILTGGYLLGIAFDLAPLLRGPDEWRWARAIPGTLHRLWLPAAGLILYGVLAVLSHRAPPRRQRMAAILLAMVAVPAIQLTLLYMDHPDVRSQLFYRTVSEESGGFYNVGVTAQDPSTFLQTYAERMPDFPVHPQRHPPGLSLLFLLTREWLAGQPQLAHAIADQLRPYQCHNLPLMSLKNAAIAAAALQMLVPLLLALLVPPLHALTRRHYDEQVANVAILLFPLIPSVGLWATRWNQLYGIFTLFMLLLLNLGLERRRPLLLFLAGVTISVASFFTFGNFALVGFAGCYGLAWLWMHRRAATALWFWGSVGLAAAGTVSLWLLLLMADVNLAALMEQSLGLHYGLERNYWLWLWYHLFDFFVFLGIPLAVLWFYGLFQAIRGRRQSDLLLISFALGLFLLDVSGTSQGEVARVWSFLLPVALATAVQPLARHRGAFAAILGLMAIQLFVSNVYLRPVGTGLSDPPPAPPSRAVAGDIAQEQWDAGPVLLDATVSNGNERVRVEALWSTMEQIERPYTIFVHGVDQSGALVAQDDGQPLDGTWPATCWQVGEAFVDRYELAVPAGFSPKTLDIRLGFYWLPTGDRVPIDATGADAAVIR